MLGGFGLMGLTNIHQMNALKVVLAISINGVALVVFIAARKVVWQPAIAMMAASLIGGYLAAHYSRHLPSRFLRWFVVVVGLSLSVYFFLKLYGGGVSVR